MGVRLTLGGSPHECWTHAVMNPPFGHALSHHASPSAQKSSHAARDGLAEPTVSDPTTMIESMTERQSHRIDASSGRCASFPLACPACENDIRDVPKVNTDRLEYGLLAFDVKQGNDEVIDCSTNVEQVPA